MAEELHFGRAAERLQITPSYVSQTIRTLEAKLGGRLFERSSRRVQLTPLGEEMRQRTRPAYEQLQRACLDVGERARGVAGTLRLGQYVYRAGEPSLHQIIKVFESRHPGCQVRVTETPVAPDPLDGLRRGEVDMLVLRPVHDPDVQVGPVLAREPRLLAVAVDHQLAERKSVDVEDLADYTTTDVPAVSREIMDEFSPPHTPSGRPIERAELHSITEAVARVATGELVHPTVPAFFEAFPDPRVTAIPIRDLPPAETVLLWLAANHSPKVRAFAACAGDVLAADPLPAPALPWQSPSAESAR